MDPRDRGEPKNTTKPAEASAITARVRAAKREGNGTERHPPDHQETEPPDSMNSATSQTAEPDQAPGAEYRPDGARNGGDTGPKAARQRTRPGEPDPKDNAAASAPTQHPTTSDRPDRTNAPATRETKADPPAGSERDPASATTATRPPPQTKPAEPAQRGTGAATSPPGAPP